MTMNAPTCMARALLAVPYVLCLLAAGCILAPDLDSAGYITCTSHEQCRPTGRVCTPAGPGPQYCTPPEWWNANYAVRRQLTVTNRLDVPLPKGFPLRITVGPEPRMFRVDDFNTSARLVAVDRAGSTPTQVELDVAVDVLTRESFDALVPLPAELPPGASTMDLWLYTIPGQPSPRADKSSTVFTLLDDFEDPTLDPALWRSEGPATWQDGDIKMARNGYLWSTTALPAVPGVQLTVDFTLTDPDTCQGLTMGLISGATRAYNTPYVSIETTASGNFVTQALRDDTFPLEPLAPAMFAAGTSATRLDMVVSGRSVRVSVRGSVVDSFEMEGPIPDDEELHPKIFVEGGSCEVLVHKLRLRPASAPEPTVSVGARVPRP